MNYKEMSLLQLRDVAKEIGIKSAYKFKKNELISEIEKVRAASSAKSEENQPASSAKPEENQPAAPVQQEQTVRPVRTERRTYPVEGEQRQYKDQGDISLVHGILEILADGFGFLRTDNYLSGTGDIYVSPMQIRRFNLKTGDEVCGKARIQKDERFPALIYVETVNGDGVDVSIRRKPFESLTPVYPDKKIPLSLVQNDFATRLIDLIAPIGYGQRGLIVAPPKAGKTTILKSIAKSITAGSKGSKLIVLLIDERPEEVTDMQRSIDGEVVFSTFDEPPEHHVKVAEIVLERAQRLVEHGKDVIILLDSITRLSRAYNLTVPPSGKTLSGGLDPSALHKPKRFFGAARNIEGGGSLTILATALIETGSRMDDMIFEEFKGTGNMEIHLDRKLSEKRIFPAVDIYKSGTRKEELLLSLRELEAMWTIRKAFDNTSPQEVTQTIVNKLVSTKNNNDFVELMLKSF